MELLTKGTQLQKISKVDIYLRIGTFSQKKKNWIHSLIKYIALIQSITKKKKAMIEISFKGRCFDERNRENAQLPTYNLHTFLRNVMSIISGDNRQDVLKKDQSHSLRKLSCYTI